MNIENKIDLSELQRQREEVIRKENKYCEFRIIVGLNDKMPYAHFESRGVTSFEHALLMKCVDEFKRGLIQRDPISKEIYENMRIETTHIDQKLKGDNK